jgi:MoaA/NifB/PqqE/SkfB family radical SAM enzyme
MYSGLFNQKIQALHGEVAASIFRTPRTGFFLTKNYFYQKKAAKVRQNESLTGLSVPPVLVISITRLCNLNCAGCYAKHKEKADAKPLTKEDTFRIVREAEELGVSIIIIAGGEPFTQPWLKDLGHSFPRMMFIVFTNGLLTDAKSLKTVPNMIPVISIEGKDCQTDERRGNGVSEKLRIKFDELRQNKIFYGLSITATAGNIGTIMDPGFPAFTRSLGSRLVFAVEFVPLAEQDKKMVLHREDREKLIETMKRYQRENDGLFISFPGDESQYGGCLAAGRGFVHISPEGRIEPCPFSPVSGVDVRESGLREALKSKFLEVIRANHDMLTESEGGCALWANRKQLELVLQAV